MKQIRIVLADEHQTVREGLRLLLNSQSDLRVVGDEGTVADVIKVVREQRVHLVLTETCLAGITGVELIARLKALPALVKVLAFTAQESAESLQAMLTAGASGYVLKRSSSAELFRAIRTSHAGKFYCDPIMAGQTLACQATGHEAQWDGSRLLSEQQANVLRLVAWGHGNKEIAERLHISVKTVETYRARLQHKLDIKSRPDLVLFALKQGWLRAP